MGLPFETPGEYDDTGPEPAGYTGDLAPGDYDGFSHDPSGGEGGGYEDADEADVEDEDYEDEDEDEDFDDEELEGDGYGDLAGWGRPAGEHAAGEQA